METGPTPNSTLAETGRRLGCQTVDFDPRMCEVSFVGTRQRTRGCSPQGLGGVLALVQGL